MPSSYNIVNESAYATSWYDNGEKSADEELSSFRSLQRLRESSRKLIKNEAVASGSQSAYVNTIIGGKMKVEVVSKNKQLQTKAQKVLDENLKGVDLNQTQDLTQLNEMVISSSYSDGDVLLIVPIDKQRRGLKTYIDVIEASRIKTRPKDKNNVLVREGVEYYTNGKVKGYWVIKSKKYNKALTYYSSKDEDFEFFPVVKKDGSLERRVAWMFSAVTTRRPAQSRQVPVLTASMELLRYYGKYLEATLVGARVSACFSAFVKTSNPASAQKALNDAPDPRSGKKLAKLQPGTISYLRPNEDITFAAPNKPSDNFDKFILRLQRIFSMQQQLPYESLFLDLSETNYSSWRGGQLKVEQNVNRWRREITNFNLWYINTLLAEAFSNGTLVGSANSLKIKIRYPKFKTLDEEKTERANKTRLTNQTSSKQMIADEQGTDWEDLNQELDNEMVIETTREAEKLRLQKELEEEFDITFPDTIKVEKTSTLRNGETKDENGQVSEDDKKERRKEDGNW